MVQPDPTGLLEAVGIEYPLIGFYDAPDSAPFEPLVRPQGCFFECFDRWPKGQTVHITADKFGCPGAGYWLCGVETRPRDAFVDFLAKDEGLKASPELMNRYLDYRRPYRRRNEHILIGPLNAAQYEYLRTVTFYVNPDQLGLLGIGAQYQHAGGDPPPVVAPFGSGCMLLAALFDDLEIPQAIIGATDIAMRKYLPPDLLGFTVTRPLFEQLCALDESSFLYKPFWKGLQKARGHA